MRASYAALVLATVAITHVAAGPLKHNHAHFHQKKEAELKVEQTIEERAVDWSKVSYTYSVGQTWGQPTPAPAPVNAAAAAPAAPAAPTSVAAAPAAATSAAKAAASSAPGAASSSSATDATVILTDADKARLTSMGAQVGINSQTNNGQAWIGTDGTFVMEAINQSGDDIILVCWGAVSSWINAVQPYITHSLANGQKTSISFAEGHIGGCGAAYPETKMVNGQLQTTWQEHSFGGFPTLDVSREVYMLGREIDVLTPVGCKSNFKQCVFQCSDPSEISCLTGYELLGCDNGSQPGAQYGYYDNAPSGGCGCGSGGTITTTFL